MSVATKRKHVHREVTEELILPSQDQKIVRVLAGRGNNLHEVEDEDGLRFLVSMPQKYRRTVWICRGSFVIVQRIPEGDKVQAEIVHVLYNENVKYIQQMNLWPDAFATGGGDDDKDAAISKATTSEASYIDQDMLPPSDTSSDSDNDDPKNANSESDNDSDKEDLEATIERVHNPNRNHGIFDSVDQKPSNGELSRASNIDKLDEETIVT